MKISDLKYNDTVILRCGMKCIFNKFNFPNSNNFIPKEDHLSVFLVNKDSNLYIARLCYYNDDLTYKYNEIFDIIKIIRNGKEQQQILCN